MPNLNKVLLMGHLTRDVEMRYTPNGSAVADFGLATNRHWKGADGEKHDESTFVDITCWGKTAELAKQYLSKGHAVFIEGYLKLDQWTADGQKRSKLKVVCESMQFIGEKRESRQETPAETEYGNYDRGGDDPPF